MRNRVLAPAVKRTNQNLAEQDASPLPAAAQQRRGGRRGRHGRSWPEAYRLLTARRIMLRAPGGLLGVSAHLAPEIAASRPPLVPSSRGRLFPCSGFLLAFSPLDWVLEQAPGLETERE